MKFRFVDRITAWTPHQRICGVKVVSFEEYSLKEPFGDEGRLPETLLLECLLQLGNWLILLSSDFQQMGAMVKLGRVEFHESLRLGQTLSMEVSLRQSREEGFVLTGAGCVNGHTVISGLDCLAVAVAAKDFVDPSALRVLFSEIYQSPARTAT